MGAAPISGSARGCGGQHTLAVKGLESISRWEDTSASPGRDWQHPCMQRGAAVPRDPSAGSTPALPPKELLPARPQPCARAEMGNTCRCSSTHERKSLGFIALTAWHAHILLKASQGTQSQKGSGQAQPTDCTSSRFAIFYSSISHQIAAAARGTGVHGGGNKGALDGVLRQL